MKTAAPGFAPAPESPSARPGSASDAPSARVAFTAAIQPLLDALHYELKNGKKDAKRVARLNFELACLYEWPLGESAKAAGHYQKALGADRSHLPSMHGALRTLIASGKHRAALSAWDALANRAEDEREKALMLLDKARFVEDTLGDERGARALYYSAASLVNEEPEVLANLEKSELKAGHWNALEKVYGQYTDSAQSPPLKAARLLQHARIVEVYRNDPGAAIELYEQAMDLDAHAAGPARAALTRLYTAEKRWADLTMVLELEASATRDTAKRAMLHYEVGRTQAERLGDREEAIAALARASVESQDDPAVLTYLARLLEAEGRNEALTPVLRRLVAKKDTAAERQALLHRIGQLAEQSGDEAAAIAEHEAALVVDPTFVPILRALGRLYSKHERWDDLIAMHLGEARATDDLHRKASAHMRVAMILEVRLHEPKQAIEHHEKALRCQPVFAPSSHALTRLYTSIGDFNKLAELYEHIIEFTDHANHELLIEWLMKLGSVYDDYAYNPGKAIEIYRRVLKLDEAHLGAVHALQRSADLGERYDILVEALEGEARMTDDEERVVALLARSGDIRDRQLNDTAGALAAYTQVLKLRPKHRVVLASLGRHHHRARRWDELLAVYEQELAAIGSEAPAAVALMHKMGDLCERQLERSADAMGWYQKATRVDPTYSPAVDALERRLRADDRYSDLVALLERQRDHQVGTERASTCLELGLVYEENLEVADDAIASYNEALELVPGHAVATEALRRLNAKVGAWEEVLTETEGLAAAAHDPGDQITAWLTAAEVCRDHLSDGARATTFYGYVLEREPDHPSALVALEAQTRLDGDWEALASILEREVQSFSDPPARLAALRELGWLYENRLERLEDAQATYEEILSLHGDDARALVALERLAYARDDRELLVRVLSGRLRHATDPSDVSALRVRMAEALEVLDDDDAQSHYEAALATGVPSVTAVRGLVRTAERKGDSHTLAEALRQEASLTLHPVSAAACLVRSALITDEELQDPEKASRDLIEALELAPGHPEASAAVSGLLRRLGEHARLADVLEKAADGAKNGDQVAELRLEAATIRADVLDDLETAIDKLAKSAKRAPQHMESHRKLAELFARREDWKDAVRAWDQVLMAAREDQVKRHARLTLADILETHLDDRLKAAMHLRTLLKTFPADVEALSKLVNLMIGGNAYKDALPVANDLASAIEEAPAKADAYLIVGDVNLELNREEDAVLAFEKAIALVGPGGEAGRKYTAQLPRFGTWEHYARATYEFLKAHTDDATSESVWIELLRVFEEELDDPRQAAEAAQSGLDACANSHILFLGLGRCLRKSGQPGEASAVLTRLIASAPSSSEAWSELSEAYAAHGKDSHAAIASSAESVLGGEVLERRRRSAGSEPGSMSVEVFGPLEADDVPATGELLAALAPALAKLNGFVGEDHGVTARERLTNKKVGLRKTAETLLAVFGVKKLGDLYLGPASLDAVVSWVGDRPILIAPQWLEDCSEAEQVYALAQPLASFVRGLSAVDALSPRAVEAALSAMAGTGDRDLATKLTKASPRAIRKQLPELAEATLAEGALEIADWCVAVRRTARRVALLVADDLGAALTILRREKGLPADVGAAELVASDEDAADLVAFWGADAAMKWRANVGQL